MQWSSEQIVRYLESPEFFDTAIIPCYRITLNDDTLDDQIANEKQMTRVLELESRLKGRIVLFPALVAYGPDKIHKSIFEAIHTTLHNKFKHIIFIPFDETIAMQLQHAIENAEGMILSVDHRIDWFSEIVTIWNQK